MREAEDYTAEGGDESSLLADKSGRARARFAIKSWLLCARWGRGRTMLIDAGIAPSENRTARMGVRCTGIGEVSFRSKSSECRGGAYMQRRGIVYPMDEAERHGVVGETLCRLKIAGVTSSYR